MYKVNLLAELKLFRKKLKLHLLLHGTILIAF